MTSAKPHLNPESEKIICTHKGKTAYLTLNRPQALNALDFDMIEGLQSALNFYESDSHTNVIVIQSTIEKAFCAGGDIKKAFNLRNEDPNLSPALFFEREYQLNYHISKLKKPYVALMDGIAMGGGLGISIHGTHRIVTEHSILAMPETTIGFHPDVGGSHFLNQMPVPLGLYLGLTGARLNAADALYTGLTTHFVPRTQLSSFKETLENDGLDIALKHYAQDTIPSQESTLKTHEDEIKTYFSSSSVEEIIKKLKASDTPFARETYETIIKKSPISLKVTFESFRKARSFSLKEALAQECVLSKHFANNHDVYEGIRALLIDKDNAPKWLPATLSEVTEEMVAAYFSHSNAWSPKD